MNVFVNIAQLLARYTAIVIIVAAIVAMIEPATFSWVKGDMQILVLGTIMLGMGMTLGKEDYKILAKRPLDILVGTAAQYTIMPILAIAIGRGLGLSDGLTLGLVLVGSCPGGVSSNIMSYLAKGDVAFSVGMTTVSTLIAPIAAPLWMLYLVGETVAMDGWGMFRFMLMVTLFPVLIGSAANILLHKKSWFGDVKNIMPGVAVLAFAAIVGGVSAVHGGRFLESALVMVVAIALHNFGGYVLGYFSGKAMDMSVAKKRTLAIEVGVQNAGLATGLSAKFFPTNAESAVACAVACVWHSVSGTVLGNAFGWWDKRKAQQESPMVVKQA